MLKYNVTSKVKPTYMAEYVVPLPRYADPTDGNATKTAKQSEVHALANGQFLVLARDSGSGRGSDSTRSVYRHIDIVDLAGATDIKTEAGEDSNGDGDGPGYDCAACSVADPKSGALKPGVVTAEYCSWLDFNDDAQLARFSLRNGGVDDERLLNEKWESIAVVPANPPPGQDIGQPGSPGPDEYFIFSLSDNDFVTQHGHLNGGKFHYADASGNSIDSQALVFRVRIPPK